MRTFGVIMVVILSFSAAGCAAARKTPAARAAHAARPPKPAPEAVEFRHVRVWPVLGFEHSGERIAWRSNPIQRPRSVRHKARRGNRAQRPRTLARRPWLTGLKLPKFIFRTSRAPHGGLWSLRTRIVTGGALSHRFKALRNWRAADTFCAYVRESSGIRHSGFINASAFVQDSTGHIFIGDAYPVLSAWRSLPLSLRAAERAGVHISAIRRVGVSFQKVHGRTGLPLIVQTDDWSATDHVTAYTGQSNGLPRTFFVRRNGGRLTVGVVNEWQLCFHRRSGVRRPWLTARQGPRGQLVLGSRGAGLMLLNQAMFDRFRAAVSQDASNTPHWQAKSRAGPAAPARTIAAPRYGFPGRQCVYHWRCVWWSPVAALVRVRESCGPLDRLARPAQIIHWQFMIYASGAVFGHVSWAGPAGRAVPRPIAIALALPRGAYSNAFNKPPTTAAGHMLQAFYPRAMRRVPLPNAMQRGAPLALAGKWGRPAERLYWRARVGSVCLAGMGLPRRDRAGPLNFLLLINRPNQLQQAAWFSAYLDPPQVDTQLGHLQHSYPGDVNNDSLVDAYGFQAISLRAGHAMFDLFPGPRPLMYPVFLFTGRAAAPGSAPGLLANIEGTAIEHLPRFKNGALLLVPFPLARPVHVEVGPR